MALFAAIDCGTNTFHLIVVEFTKGSPWKTVFRQRVFVYLAEDGIGHISVNAKKRAVDAFAIFSEKLKELNVSNIRAYGTAGLRTAKNAIELIREIQNKFAIDIEIIDGEKEAALIQKGVMHYAPANPLPYLIMDIGGGSVEFILWQDKVLWSKSFPIGVSIIYNTFHQADPLSKATIQSVFEWLNLQLKDLKTVLKVAGPFTLIGAGGTFDVIENIIGKRDTLNQFTTAYIEEFLKLSHSIQLLDQQQRAEFPGIPPYRSKLAIEAFLLVEFTLSCGEFDKMVIVEGDIKDGILLEMIQSSI